MTDSDGMPRDPDEDSLAPVCDHVDVADNDMNALIRSHRTIKQFGDEP